MPDHRPLLHARWLQTFVLHASSHSQYGGILALSLRRALASALRRCANNFLSRRSIFSHMFPARWTRARRDLQSAPYPRRQVSRGLEWSKSTISAALRINSALILSSASAIIRFERRPADLLRDHWRDCELPPCVIAILLRPNTLARYSPVASCPRVLLSGETRINGTPFDVRARIWRILVEWFVLVLQTLRLIERPGTCSRKNFGKQIPIS